MRPIALVRQKQAGKNASLTSLIVCLLCSSRQSQARYFYDAFGRRIAKEVNGERTVFGWDGDALAYESDGERGTHYFYEPGSFVPLAQYVTEPVAGIATPELKSADRYTPEDDPLQKIPERRTNAKLFYYHCDQIGTPQLLTDDDGDVVWEASYKAWGEAREVIARASKAAGIVPRNPLRFQGQWVDDETGLHYNRNRYYDPGTGRFVSKDPIGLRGGFNVYAYASNPVEWADPLGLAPCDCLTKTQCKLLLAKIYLKALGEKKTDGSRGLKERIDHLKEDTYKLYDFAPQMGDKRDYGALAGKGTYEGHVRAAQQLQNGLRQNIRDFEDGGCSSFYAIPQKIRTVAFDTDIPTAPEGR